MSKSPTFVNALILSALALGQGMIVPALAGPEKPVVQPITIDADRAQLDRDSSSSVYSGNVRMTQGNLKLEGDQITVLHDAKGQPISATIIGSPARYEQQVSTNEPPVRGHADRMEYSAKTEILTLTGNARVERGGDIVTGETVSYDRARNKILASGVPSSRVHITFTPNQSTDTTNTPSTPAANPPKDNAR